MAQEIEEYEFRKGAVDSNYFDKKFPDPVEEGQEPANAPPTDRIDEELAAIENKYKTLKVMAKNFLKNDEWIAMVKNLLQYRVQRYPQIIQSLMFLTGSVREDICLPATNKLHWKWIRQIKHDQIPKAMLAYSMYGQTKGKNIIAYQTLNYCEGIIEGIHADDVETYHSGLGKLFKWLKTAIEGRKLDITRRKIVKRKEGEDRQQKIEREEDRKQRREDFITDSKSEWETEQADNLEEYKIYMDRKRRSEAGEPVSNDEDEDVDEDGKPKPAPQKPIFNEVEAFGKFDAKEENIIVQIPAEIKQDVDDDWPMSSEEEQEFVERTLASREGQ